MAEGAAELERQIARAVRNARAYDERKEKRRSNTLLAATVLAAASVLYLLARQLVIFEEAFRHFESVFVFRTKGRRP